MERKLYWGVRTWIIFSSIIGILSTLTLLFYFFKKYSSSELGIYSYGDLGSGKGVIWLTMIFIAIPSLIFNIGLIHYASKSLNQEFLNNKWALAVLSLSVGGILAPMGLTFLPDVPVRGTKNARIVIVRFFGLSGVLASFAGLLSLLLFYKSSSIKSWELTGNNWYLISNSPQKSFYFLLGLLIFIFLFCVLTAPWFFQKNISEVMNNVSTSSYVYKFISGVYVFVASILLIFQVITAILRVVAMIADVFKNSDGKTEIDIFAILYIFSAIGQVIMQGYITIQVVKGLYDKDNNYHVLIPQYRSDDWKEAEENVSLEG